MTFSSESFVFSSYKSAKRMTRWRYTSIHSLYWHLMKVSGQLLSPSAFNSRKRAPVRAGREVVWTPELK
jgi:hypothetical protein